MHVWNARLLAPLVALLALALSAIVIAAQAGLSFCNARVAIGAPRMDDMAGMPGMTMMSMPGMASMPDDHRLMICPVVLALIIATALLAAAATVLLCADPDRALTRRMVARSLARLPLLPAAGGLALFAAIAVGVMISLDGSGVPGAPVCALMLSVMLAGSIAAVLLAVFLGRAVLALGERLLVAIVAAIAQRAPAAPAFMTRRVPALLCGTRSCLLAAGRGLRAPPSFVR